MKPFGERNWWAQARRHRFQQRLGLHEAPTPTTPPADILAEPGEDIDSDIEALPVAAGSATMGR